MASLPFVAMKRIKKETSTWEHPCTDWVATEKIHGASFQFFTKGGDDISVASRRNILNNNRTFQKCNLQEFRDRHMQMIRNMVRIIETQDKWHIYRTDWGAETVLGDEDDDDEAENEQDGADDVHEVTVEMECDCTNKGSDETQNTNSNSTTDRNMDQELFEENVPHKNANTNTDMHAEDETVQQELRQTETHVELRIYGELYGGGGVKNDIKPAIQKEIIYADEYRFYVFAISINMKWVTVLEMNELCREAGFPFFAEPVCEPKPTLQDLVNWLTTSGFMTSRSRYTDRTDNFKTTIEGVVMTPLTRKDLSLHPIKLLSSAFNDVRQVSKKGKPQAPNYVTKARYHSVISKLDICEREDADAVVEMYINDILEESGESSVSNNKRKAWTRLVRGWLIKDGYLEDPQLGNEVTKKDGGNFPGAEAGERKDLAKQKSSALAETARIGSRNGVEKKVDKGEDGDSEENSDEEAFLGCVEGLFS